MAAVCLHQAKGFVHLASRRRHVIALSVDADYPLGKGQPQEKPASDPGRSLGEPEVDGTTAWLPPPIAVKAPKGAFTDEH